VPAHDWEALGRDDDGNLWIGDIGNNECDRADTALLKVREPDPAAEGPATVLATYRYRFPDPPPGCAGRNAEAMFLLDDVPYLIDKAAPSTPTPRSTSTGPATPGSAASAGGRPDRPPAALDHPAGPPRRHHPGQRGGRGVRLRQPRPHPAGREP
jgi:hypothetical protein